MSVCLRISSPGNHGHHCFTSVPKNRMIYSLSSIHRLYRSGGPLNSLNAKAIPIPFSGFKVHTASGWEWDHSIVTRIYIYLAHIHMPSY